MPSGVKELDIASEWTNCHCSQFRSCRMTFVYSPDFRARASSNASSTGRLSPILSEHLHQGDYSFRSSSDQRQDNVLAFSLEHNVRLTSTQQPQPPLESYSDVFLQDSRPPPPPYNSCISFQSCSIHGCQGCSCFNNIKQIENSYIKQVGCSRARPL